MTQTLSFNKLSICPFPSSVLFTPWWVVRAACVSGRAALTCALSHYGGGRWPHTTLVVIMSTRDPEGFNSDEDSESELMSTGDTDSASYSGSSIHSSGAEETALRWWETISEGLESSNTSDQYRPTWPGLGRGLCTEATATDGCLNHEKHSSHCRMTTFFCRTHKVHCFVIHGIGPTTDLSPPYTDAMAQSIMSLQFKLRAFNRLSPGLHKTASELSANWELARDQHQAHRCLVYDLTQDLRASRIEAEAYRSSFLNLSLHCGF